MARQVTYKYKKQVKVISFSFDKYHDMYEAAAAAEGVDISNFLEMEKQLSMSTRDKATIKQYRELSFTRMGFSHIRFLKDEEQEQLKSENN
ncbi:DUF2960 domain-containing protein [Agarivorans sp. MS3-6]|uniref:DUF2960 domain-containing protein n=1 Tax=Agarivorans sp. TSD2052 TaxID=2937286 RepID=UPI00200DBAB7|nr:DUF2960 domain-containing protein [Agarivorans sp. TSD2052]UPW19567.1 DUF2960 domain-containing protein [Agarivorans sp. TSD2052]